MKKAVAALVALQYIAHASAAAPRGVGPEFAGFYADTKTFTCISSKLKIPRNRVNDDYCDCPDGSDEPGTSACAHLSPFSPQTEASNPPKDVNGTPALPGFYCENKGHIPSYIPFTNVNDGLCDYELCCDGSEEWEAVGGIKCKDKCDEIGKEWRKRDATRQKAMSSATKKRNELVKEAARLKQQVKDRLQSLRTEIGGGEIKVTNLEKELQETIKREARKKASSSGTGKLGELIELGRQRTDALREHLLSTREELRLKRTQMKQLEEILTAFKRDYNPNFNDEGVKTAVRAWEDYVADQGMSMPEDTAGEEALDTVTKPDNENGLDWALYEGGGDEDGDDIVAIYDFLNYLPPTIRRFLDDKIRDLRQALIDGGILADSSSDSDGSESHKVTEARVQLKSAQDDLDGHRKNIQESTDDLAKDYGPDDVFRALKGTCIEKDSGEYVYELCFLDRTSQKKKSGGSTNMGTYEGIEKVVVDEDLPTDGKGLGSGERWAMKHTGGQHCWNGPNRSTTVILACSEEHEIWKVYEEEKCVYKMEVGTPAVCEAVKVKEAAKGKDEL